MIPNASNSNPDPDYLRSLIARAGLSIKAAAKTIGVKNVTMASYLLPTTAPGYRRAPYSVQFALEAIPTGDMEKAFDALRLISMGRGTVLELADIAIAVNGSSTDWGATVLADSAQDAIFSLRDYADRLYRQGGTLEATTCSEQADEFETRWAEATKT